MMDRTGEVQPLHLQPGIYAFPNVSPDGTRVAFQSDDGKEAILYTYELSGASTMQRLTSGGNNRFPVWVSNRRVAFQSDRAGDLGLWWQGLDGVAERLTKAEPGTSHAPESSAGDTLLYSVTNGTDVSLWTISLTTRTQSRVETPPSEAPMGAVLSPDGTWVSYATTQGSHSTMYVQGVRTGMRFPLSARGSDTPKHPRWSRDGKEILYNPNAGAFESARILAIDPLTFGKATPLPKRLQSGPPGTRTPYDVMPDGRLIGLVTAGQKEYVRGSVNQIRIVLNWFEELKARARRR
jgi:Tol biopolymer transport system component